MSQQFITKDLINIILKQSEADDLLDITLIDQLASLIELETRHILQQSTKFMRNEKRQMITEDDVIDAVKDNGHKDIYLQDYQQTKINKNRTIYSLGQNLQEELQFLNNTTIQSSFVNGRWILIKGIVPTLQQNFDIQTLSQQIKYKKSENQQKRTLFKIIKDDPLSLLSKEQLEYYKSMCQMMKLNIKPQGDFKIEENVNGLLPFFLKFIGEKQTNQTSIWFLMKLIQNKYIWPNIEYSLKKILNILLAYRGIYSFEVGTKIAQLVERFQSKYPTLRDIYIEYKDNSYSMILKQIPFQLQLGIPLQLNQKILQKCKEDSDNNDKMAILCNEALTYYSSELKQMKNLLAKKNTYIYWHPCNELDSDPYLSMF